MEFAGVVLNTNFHPGSGDIGSLPTGHGFSAQIHWPTLGIRNGESGVVRSRNQGHRRWAEKHRLGLHLSKEANRRGIIVEHAMTCGSLGTEFYLISQDQRLADRVFRVECEKLLHEGARNQTTYWNMNTQRGYRTVN